MMRARSAALSTAVLVAACPALSGYVREAYKGNWLRPGSQILFSVDPTVVAGLRNGDGTLIITPESDPVAALRAAMQTWSTVPAAAVNVNLTVSRNGGPGRDFVNTISFADTASARSLVSGAIAVTMNTITSQAVIVDSDIVFNPAMTFATTPTLGCFDIQAIATHELGHTLGADHSLLSSATMFAYGAEEETWPRHLSTDDIAFITDAFPRDLAGGILGTLTFSSGKGPPSAMVLVINPATGFVVAPFAPGGTWSTGGLPPGDYFVMTMPLSPYLDLADWQSTFYGGDTPRMVSVKAGDLALVDITIPNGPAKLTIEYAVYGSGFQFGGLIPSGAPLEVLLLGKGMTDAIRPEDISISAPGVVVRADSLRAIQSQTPDLPGTLSFTADVAVRADWTDAVMTIRSTGLAAVSSGIRTMPVGPYVTPSNIRNAASFRSGAVAPGEIVSLLGSGIGPDTPLTGAVEGAGRTVTRLGETEVEFDGQPAPLLYASSVQVNAQVPFEVAGHANTQVRLRYKDGTSQANLPVTAASLAIFGGALQPAVMNQDGSVNDNSHPAAQGSVIVAYGTGQGVPDPPLATGAPASAAPLSTVQITASIGGAAARVEFAGMAPSFVGLLQVNVAIPEAVPGGLVPLQLTMGGSTSEPVFVWVE